MIATLEKFSREELDALVVESQHRAQHAIANGHFDRSVMPVFNDDGTVALDREEFPRPRTTLESLAALPTVFSSLWRRRLTTLGETFQQLVARKYPDLSINHVHHAGNSSGVVDGAAALILSSKDYADKGLETARAHHIDGNSWRRPYTDVERTRACSKKGFARVGMTTDDIDLFEINEAFAVVAAKFIRDLNLDPAKVNVNGGAMALGHPIAATGSILIGTMIDELERRDLQTGLITMCTGGGMAPAIIIERVTLKAQSVSATDTVADAIRFFANQLRTRPARHSVTSSASCGSLVLTKRESLLENDGAAPPNCHAFGLLKFNDASCSDMIEHAAL